MSNSSVFPTQLEPQRCPFGFGETVGIPESVAARAAANPDAIAVTSKDAVLSYRELDSKANELATSLRTLGVGPDVVVGLCLQPSPAMIIGALAVLKAGGAYLPLDPTYPPARLSFVLNDAGVAILITGTCFADRFTDGGWHLVCVDPLGNQTSSRVGSKNTVSASVSAGPEDLAYVIYTSGSTGQPKGVEITRRSLLNLISWHQRAFGITAVDRATQVSSPGFDAAVWEVWPYLTAGASLHIGGESVRTDPALLRDWLVQQGITITFVPTPMAEQLMQLEWPHTNSLRILLTGADTLHRYPSVDLPFQLVNNYGPTECTVVSTSASIAPSEAADSLPPIGRPIDNVRVYILDEKMQPVPLGNEGELYIGGAGVARGYRNRPELTKERFVPDPFVPGARLYRSGDSVRYLNDGQLAFLGRIDEQVKIRGYRIEPSEIVAALNACSMIRASYVMAHEDEAGNRRLVAYIAPESEQSLTDKDIRAFLSTRIPDYMIPAVFVVMESLPINASGKIDRKSLPEPSELNILKDETYVSPRSAIEHAVAGMMSTLLRFDKIGLNDNFFLLGGNSLLGAQVIARVRETFDVELSLLGLFDNPTVAELSAEIERLILAKLDAKSEEDANQLARSAGQE